MQRTSLRVLVTGGTGSIGGALVSVLKRRGHQVTCLVRSEVSESKLHQAGFATIRGDITEPGKWLEAVANYDAVVPVAATWCDDMVSVDTHLTQLLIEALATSGAGKTLIYTSGCWVYGATGNTIATESTQHCLSSEFAWGSDLSQRVLDSKGIRGMVILPAMVYERDGGVLEPMISDAIQRKRIRLVGSEETRWPMVHRYDLAVLYALMLECGQQGAVYNAAATHGVQVGEIARVISERYRLQQQPEVVSVEEAIVTMGSWASGYSIDQQMSGQKATKELLWVPEYPDVLAELE